MSALEKRRFVCIRYMICRAGVDIQTEFSAVRVIGKKRSKMEECTADCTR